MIGMALGFTATAIFIVFTMIMICVDASQRNKDLKKALEEDMQVMTDLDFTEDEIKLLKDKFLSQYGMNLDQLKAEEEAEQMAAMNWAPRLFYFRLQTCLSFGTVSALRADAGPGATQADQEKQLILF